MFKIAHLDFVYGLNYKKENKYKHKLQSFGTWILLPVSDKKGEEDRDRICRVPSLRPGHQQH